MIGWIETHGVEALLIYYVFAAVIGGMPTPASDAGVAYQWVFRSFSLLGANVARLVATQMPGTGIAKALVGNGTTAPKA